MPGSYGGSPPPMTTSIGGCAPPCCACCAPSVSATAVPGGRDSYTGDTMAVLGQLADLDRLDTAIAGLESERSELVRRQRQNPELTQARTRAEALRVRDEAESRALRSLEADLARVEAQLRRDQQRMYGGQIV